MQMMMILAENRVTSTGAGGGLGGGDVMCMY